MSILLDLIRWMAWARPTCHYHMARQPRTRSLSSTGHYAAGCVTVTLLAALSLILLRGPAAEKRCDLSSYDPASTEALDLKRCKISTLPVAIAEFRRLKKLDLGFNALQALPALPPSLEVLFLLANGFEEVASPGSGLLSQALRLALTLALTYPPSPSPSPDPSSYPNPNPNLLRARTATRCLQRSHSCRGCACSRSRVARCAPCTCRCPCRSSGSSSPTTGWRSCRTRSVISC